MRGGYSASMRLVAVLSVAFVVLVGVVAVTYPNESDEVRQRNAAFMKLDGIKGEANIISTLSTCPTTENFKPNILGLKQGDLLGISAEGLDVLCQDLNEMSRIVESLDVLCEDLNQISRILKKLDAKDPVAADLRVAVERTKNTLSVLWGGNDDWDRLSRQPSGNATDEGAKIEDRLDDDFDANDMVFDACASFNWQENS